MKRPLDVVIAKGLIGGVIGGAVGFSLCQGFVMSS